MLSSRAISAHRRRGLRPHDAHRGRTDRPTRLPRAAVLVVTAVMLSAVAAPPASANAVALGPDRVLGKGETRASSPNGHVVRMQEDGNLVVIAPGNRALWSSRTAGYRDAIARMQSDGNLVVVAPGNRPVWSSGTSGRGPANLVIQDDGNLVIYGPRGATWSSRSGVIGSPQAQSGTGTGFGGAMVRVPCPRGGSITVASQIAANLASMLAAASQSGVVLCGSGARSLKRQEQLRAKHCGAANVYNPRAKCKPQTALPGRSMHEKGLAIDFNNCGRKSANFTWLKRNAGRYGFRNLPSESWHWSTNGR